MKFLLYHTETTGLDPKTCGLHRLSGMLLEYEDNQFNLMQSFMLRMQPFKGKMVSRSAMTAGKFTIDYLRTCPDPLKNFSAFKNMLSRHVDRYNPKDKLIQVGFCIRFDTEVLRQWFRDCGDRYFGSWFWPNTIDIMSDATRVLADVRPFMRNFRLDSVAEMLGIDVTQYDTVCDSMRYVYLSFEILNRMKKYWISADCRSEKAEEITELAVSR